MCKMVAKKIPSSLSDTSMSTSDLSKFTIFLSLLWNAGGEERGHSCLHGCSERIFPVCRHACGNGRRHQKGRQGWNDAAPSGQAKSYPLRSSVMSLTLRVNCLILPAQYRSYERSRIYFLTYRVSFSVPIGSRFQSRRDPLTCEDLLALACLLLR
jgi:hypothetical protein